MSDETRERDIYLARAMGWRYVPPGPETAKLYGEGVHCLRDPKGRFLLSPWAKTEDRAWANITPQFHEWESAKAKLLRWLAADDGRWRAFEYEITDLWEPLDMSESWSRFLVALTPAQVAEAAEKALLALCAEQEAGNAASQ